MFFASAVALYCAACHANAERGSRDAVRFRLDQSSLIVAPEGTELVILEFGSIGCEFCREFNDSILPVLRDRPSAPPSDLASI